MKPVNELLESNDDALLTDEIYKRKEMVKQLRNETCRIIRHKYRRTLCANCEQSKELFIVKLNMDIVGMYTRDTTLYLCQDCITNGLLPLMPNEEGN